MQRSLFDATLQRAAIAAGAEFFDGRADEPIGDDGRLDGFSLSSTTRVRADVIIGADGATSRVAEVAGLVDPRRVLWGFAVRTYRRRAGRGPAHHVVDAGSGRSASRATAGCSPRAAGV